MANQAWTPNALAACRWHAVSGAGWSLLAATAGLILALELALGLPPPLSALGAGRLHAAYVHLALLGAISPSLAGALLLIADLPGADGEGGRWASAALGAWNTGVLLGLIGILAGRMGPEPWLAAPAVARVFLWLGAALWGALLWRTVHRRAGPLPVAMWFAVAATAGLVVYQAVGLLAGSLHGAGQAVAGAVYARGLPALWAATAGIGVAAAVLPIAARRPLFGRRSAWWGLVAWLVLAAIAAPRDLVPDLLPPWLLRPVGAATVLLLVPAVLLAIAVLGTFVGAARARDTDEVAPFLSVGMVLLLAAIVADAAVVGRARDLVQFTAWDPGVDLLPPLAGPGLLAVGAAYTTLRATGALPSRVPLRHHLTLAVAGGLLLAAPHWPLGLTEAAGGSRLWLEGGTGGGLLATGFRLQLPGMILIWLSAIAWVANSWPKRATAQGNEAKRCSWPAGGDGAPSLTMVATVTTVALVVGLLVSLFLPLADPAAVEVTARTSARDVDIVPAGLRADGRAVYIADGCVACHTQRVRGEPEDTAYGPPTERGDNAPGPALGGYRRAGPDLAWVGDRYPDRLALEDRLSVHWAGRRIAFPWLFGPEGATERGAALIDYLVGLQSGGHDQ